MIPLLRAVGRHVVYDAHEDLPAQIIDKPYLARSLKIPAVTAAKFLVRLAGTSDRIVAATETIALRFDHHKTTLVRNYPHAPGTVDRGQTGSCDRSLSAVYVGALGSIRGNTAMVDAFDSDEMPSNWRLEVAGSGSEQYLNELQARPGWSRVNFHGKVSPESAREIISRSRVGIVTFRDTVAHRDALPTKMFEYMADGVAVIASDFPLWRSIIETYDCGLLVDPDSPDSIAQAVARYANDEDLLERHCRNGMTAAVSALNWENEAKNLVRMYSGLAPLSDD